MEEDTFVKVNELYQRFKVLNDWLGKIPVKTLLISQQVSSLSQSFNVMRKAVISELNATLKNAYQPYVIPLITKKLVNEVEAYLTTYTTFKDEITAITPDRLLQLQRIAKEGSAGLQSQVQNEHEKLVTEGGIFNFLQLTEADQNEFTKLRNQSRELLNELLFYVDTTKQGRIFSKESLLKQGMKNEQLTLFNFWIADEDPEKIKFITTTP